MHRRSGDRVIGDRPTIACDVADRRSPDRRFTSACLVAAALAASACDSCTAIVSPSGLSLPAPSVARRIAVLGDSLAVSPSRDESFPAALEARLGQQRLPWTVTNGGINGDTTSGGLRRVDALIGGGDVRILVVALGANDGLRGVNVSLVEQNLAAIIERAQARQIKVLLCGMETPPLHGWDYTVAFHGVFLRLASRYSLPRVPFLLDGVAFVPSLNGDDGIHPNAAGARRIAETVWPYLEPLVLADTAAAAGSLAY